jgi:transposase
VTSLPPLDHLSHAEKDALIMALWAQVQVLTACVAELEAKLSEPAKTPDNSNTPPSKGQKPDRPEKAKRIGPRRGSLGREGGGRLLTCEPDETVIAKAARCGHCQAALTEADQVLHGRYDKIDLPVVRPVVTRVERYAGRCACCQGITLAPVPEGMEEGSPFSLNILALAIYLRFTHAISDWRLTRLFLHLFALRISEGALDAMLQRAKPCFGTEVAGILARLRRSRIVCSDETTVRIDGRTHWDWVFQNDQVVIRNSRAASVVSEVMADHRPSIWVSDLYGAQRGHADLWQVCLAHQLRGLPLCHRGGRHGLRAPHEGAAAAGLRAGSTAQDVGREHPAHLPGAVGPRSQRDHGAGADKSARQATAKTIRKGAQQLVHLPRTSRCSAR